MLEIYYKFDYFRVYVYIVLKWLSQNALVQFFMYQKIKFCVP
jgi:hypothetical protein